MVREYNFAILLQLLGTVMISVVVTLFLSLDTTASIIQIYFLMVVIGLVLMLPWVLFAPRASLFVKSWKHYFYRALFNVICIISWAEVAQETSANGAYMLDCASPVLIIILAILFCGERIGIRGVIPLLGALAGVYFIISSELSAISYEACGAKIIGIFAWGCYSLSIKIQANQGEDVFAQAFYSLLLSAIVSLPVVMFSWKPLGEVPLCLLSLLALVCICYVIVVFMAYKNAPLVVVTPFVLLKTCFVSIVAHWMFMEALHPSDYLGMAIIIISLLYFFYYVHSESFNRHL